MKSLFDQVESTARDLLAVDVFRPPSELPPSFHTQFRVVAERLARQHRDKPIAAIRAMAVEELFRFP